jgi:hypothetical protein
VAIDPTFGQFPADAAHLRLTVGGLGRQAELLRLMGPLTSRWFGELSARGFGGSAWTVRSWDLGPSCFVLWKHCATTSAVTRCPGSGRRFRFRMISLRQLTKKYGSFTAVDAIDLEVPKGELFGFLGPTEPGRPPPFA